MLAAGDDVATIWLDEVDLLGEVETSTDIAVTQDGLVAVASKSGTDAVIEYWDPYDGSKVGEETLTSTDVTYLGGVATHGTKVGSDFRDCVASTITDNSYADSDGEQVAIVNLADAYTRTSSGFASLNLRDVYSDAGGAVARVWDIDWFPIADEIVPVFYDPTGCATTNNFEMVVYGDQGGTPLDKGCIPGSGSIGAELPWSIGINPSGRDDYAYVADYQGDDGFAMVDVGGTSPWTADADYYLTCGATCDYYPRNMAWAQNGKFVALSYAQSSTTAHLLVWLLPHDNTATGSLEIQTYGNAMSATFVKPRGVAVTPLASILAPRSGKELSGLHRVYVLVRDPDVLNVSYMIDGASSADCPTDANLEDGISDTCVLDTRAWTDSDDHLLQVIFNYGGAGNSFELRAHY
jgi:hypothetical protein